MERYLTDLLEAYNGEIGGEAFFSALAQSAATPDNAAKWQMLARLEHCVAARLRPELKARGVTLPPADDELRRGLDSAAEYALLPWREALAKLRPALEAYVRDFQAAESRMPANLKSLAQFVTAHEVALLEFVIRELDDGGRQSLDSVLRLLGEPRIGAPR